MRGGRRLPGLPGQQRPYPELLGGQVLGAHAVPGAGGERAAVGERDGAAAGQPFVAAVHHVAGDPGPDETDDGAVAVVGVHAGTADLDESRADRVERREVELALGVQASGHRCALRGQQPVGADDLAGHGVADQQVVAVGVEAVHVEAGFRGGQEGAHLPGEHVVPQPLRGPYVVLVAGQGDGVAGGGDALRGTVQGGNAGHGTLQVTGGGGERCRCPCSPDAGWRVRDRFPECGCAAAERLGQGVRGLRLRRPSGVPAVSGER